MTLDNIAKHRLISQQLIATKITTPQGIVSHFGAMQAQDYSMSKWAVGIRLPGSTAPEIQTALDKGEIIRTHILRPTWHLVAAQDLRWMLGLTAPRIKASLKSRWKELELTEAVINLCKRCIEKAMVNGEHLTRDALKACFAKAGIDTNNNRLSHILLEAELDSLICSGAAQGKKQTYALMDEWVKKGKNLSKEEALVKLAHRYFTSHGPATIRDFAWWSGLTLTDARQALELIKQNFQSAEIDGEVYWFDAPLSLENGDDESVFFLPAFDEFMVSYKDRTASLDPFIAKTTITGNGIFKPIIIIKGKVVGTWKRTLKKDKVLIETNYFYPPNKLQELAVKEAATQYGNFLEMETVMQ